MLEENVDPFPFFWQEPGIAFISLGIFQINILMAGVEITPDDDLFAVGVEFITDFQQFLVEIR